MTTSDPVLFPAPAGTTDALRQDVTRTRKDLGATVEALARRLDARAAVRRQIAATRPAAPWIGSVVAGAAVYAASRWTTLGRTPRAGLATGVSAIAYLAIRSIPRNRGRVTEQLPAAIGAPLEHLALAPSPDGGDVVDVLTAQHRHIERLFDRVAAANDATDRREAFASLVDTLHRHEKAEQEIVHAALRQLGGIGATVADERSQEEAAADRAIAALINRGTEDRHFGRDLGELRVLVTAHAAREDADEFPLLRACLPVEQRQRMANQVQASRAEPW